MAVNETKIVISAEDKTKQAFQSVKNNLGQLQGLGGALGSVIGLGGVASVATILNKMVRETIDAANEQAQLAAVLRSTGQAAGFAQDELNKMADGMSRSSIFSSGEITNAQTRLLSYTGIVGKQFPAAMQAVIDMSARMGMSLEQSAETIGRALDIPSQGLTALTRQGFRFTEAQKELVKELEATGRAAQAQDIILDALETSYGGAAEAARNTLGGALSNLTNQFNDLFELSDNGSFFTVMINDLAIALEAFNAEARNIPFDALDRLLPNYDKYRAAMEAIKDEQSRLTGDSNNILPRGSLIGGAVKQDILGKDVMLGEPGGKTLRERIADQASAFTQANPLKDSIAKQDALKKKLEEVNRLEREGGLDAATAARYRAQLYEDANKGATKLTSSIKQLNEAQKETALRIEHERQAWAELEAMQRRQSDNELRALEEASAAEVEYQQRLDERALALKELFDPSLKLMNIQQQYDELLDAGLITMDEYSFAMKKAADDINGLADNGKNDFDELKRAIEGFGDSAAETFVDLAFTGKASFGDMVDSILRDMAKLAIKRGITDDLFGMADGFLGDLFGGFSFGGARASGGPVGAGKTYLVGERGPELFTPSSSGTIIPNDFTGGGNVSVNVNVDASGGDVSSNADFGKRLGTAIKQVVQQELMNERRHGGALA